MNNPTWKRQSRKVVYDNAWMTVHHDEVISPNDTQGIFGSIHFKNLAIAILPIDEDNYTWLVGQDRYTIEQYSWELPMGGGPLDIDPRLSAQKELMEEVGIQAAIFESFMEMHTSNSITDEKALVFLAKELKPLIEKPPSDDTERLTVKRLHITKAIDMALNGSITDAVSIAALLKYRIEFLK